MLIQYSRLFESPAQRWMALWCAVPSVSGPRFRSRSDGHREGMRKIRRGVTPLSSALQKFRNKRASDGTGQPHPKRMRDGIAVASTQPLEVFMQLATNVFLQSWGEFGAMLVESQLGAVAPPFNLVPGFDSQECSLVARSCACLAKEVGNLFGGDQRCTGRCGLCGVRSFH